MEPQELVADVTAGDADQREMAGRLFGAWIDEVRDYIIAQKAVAADGAGERQDSQRRTQ